MNDSLVLQRYAVSRDAEAFAVLVRTYENLVYAVCRRCLGVRAASDVDEAVQETFIKLARSAGSVRGETLAAWLHRCAVNTCLDLLRRARSRTHCEAEYARQQAQIRCEQEDVREVLHEVDAAIDKLPESERELIVGYFFARRTQQELAEEAGLTQSGIQRGLQRAIERLRRELQKRGVSVATVAVLVACLESAEAHAAIPAALGGELMKIGLSGIGPEAGHAAATSGGGIMVGLAGKAQGITAALIVSVVLVGGTAGVVKIMSGDGGAGVGGQGVVAMNGGDGAAADPATVGRWRQRGMFADGRLVGVSIEGKRVMVHQFMNDQMESGTFEFEVVYCDPTAKPMEMDLKVTKLPEGFADQRQLGRVIPFVYRITGSLVELTGASPGREERPKRVGVEEGMIYASGRWYGAGAGPAEEHSLGADGVDTALQGQWAILNDPDVIRITDDNHLIIEEENGNVILVGEISNRGKAGELTRFDLTYVQHPNANQVDTRVLCVYAMEGADVLRVAMHVPLGENMTRYPGSIAPARGLAVHEYVRIK